MKPSALIRTIATTLALLACASLDVAGGGRKFESPSRGTFVVTSLVAHSTAQGVSSGEIAPATHGASRPPADDHRPDKREHGRAVPCASLRGHRAASNRLKDASRNTPATPGMGLLLRVGTGTGRELSPLSDGVAWAPSTLGSGRAPPRASPHSNFARDPIACASALELSRVTPPSTPAGVTLPTHPASISGFSDHPHGWKHARAFAATTPRTGPGFETFQERITRSHAERFEGATA